MSTQEFGSAQNSHTQPWQAAGRLSVPVWTEGRLLGILFVDPSVDLRRATANENVQRRVSVHLNDAIAAMEGDEDAAAPPAPATGEAVSEDGLLIRKIGVNNSLFINGHYLIKGVAGAALWVLLRGYVADGRTEFSARELRLESDLKLPDVHDNLGHRLAILQRRLATHSADLHIQKISRGRFRLVVNRPVKLVDG